MVHSQVSAMGMMSAEYTEALSTLSDTTMKKAFDLLEQGSGGPMAAAGSDGTNPTTELCRLLESCKTAAKVILSETPALNLPAGSLMAGALAPASRLAPRTAGVGHIVANKKNLLPPPNHRRMSALPRLNSTKRMKVEQRPKSESAFKVMKQQPQQPDPATTTMATAENRQPNNGTNSSSSSSPPPSAMQFLAKLNKSIATATSTTAARNNNNKKKAMPPKAPAPGAPAPGAAPEVSVPSPLSSVDEDEEEEHEGEEEEHDDDEDEEMELEDGDEEEEDEEEEEEEEDEVKPRRTGRLRRPSLQNASPAPPAPPSRKQPGRSSKR
jgi:hypothetical protein